MNDDQTDHNTCDPNRMLVLSLKPRFAEAILSGQKTVELRRVEPRIKVPTRALVYASSPTCSLIGQCVVYEVHRLPLPTLWYRFGPQTSLAQEEFRAYFAGTDTGVALLLSSPVRLPSVVPLAQLRQSVDRFRAPQSFAYVGAEAGTRLLSLSS